MISEESFRESSLFVVGNINRDIKAAPIPPSDLLFHDGETSVRWIEETIGGGGANSACAAAAIGAGVTFLGKVGDDGLADRLGRTLQNHHVAHSLARSKEFSTGSSLALSFDSGHRHFLSCLPASQSLCLADLDLSTMTGHKHLLRADLWFSESMLFEGNQALLEHARKSGLAVSIDINWDPVWNIADGRAISQRKAAVRQILPLVNLAHGNVRELCTFTDSTDLESAVKRLIDWGAEAVIIHLGERGAGYFNGRELIIEPPVLAKAHVNATGTGDVLSACMMLLHHLDADVQIKLRLANRIVCEFIEGRRQLIPRLDN